MDIGAQTEGGRGDGGVVRVPDLPPNHEVAPIHPKAMPVILTKPEEWRHWLTAPVPDALQLQRPLPDGMLQIVAEGVREDAA